MILIDAFDQKSSGTMSSLVLKLSSICNFPIFISSRNFRNSVETFKTSNLATNTVSNTVSYAHNLRKKFLCNSINMRQQIYLLPLARSHSTRSNAQFTPLTAINLTCNADIQFVVMSCKFSASQNVFPLFFLAPFALL